MHPAYEKPVICHIFVGSRLAELRICSQLQAEALTPLLAKALPCKEGASKRLFSGRAPQPSSRGSRPLLERKRRLPLLRPSARNPFVRFSGIQKAALYPYSTAPKLKHSSYFGEIIVRNCSLWKFHPLRLRFRNNREKSLCHCSE